MPKILVVDDSGYTRKMIVDALEVEGYTNNIEAASADEAVKKFQAEKPDLVLLDIILIGADGLEVFRKLLKINPKVKVIVLSAIGQEAYRREAADLGVKAYITKPFDPKEMIAAIKKVL